MEELWIEGGHPLRGEVRVNGAKNAALPILAASLLAGGPCRLKGVPRLRDVAVMRQILETLGARVEEQLDDEGAAWLSVDPRTVEHEEVPVQAARQMRSSIFLMGPLLAARRHVRISYPGGCAIGPRPIDQHLKGLAALGARIEERGGFIEASHDGLVGRQVILDVPSVGATENLMMAAVAAAGRTSLHNVAKEPEIVDLAAFLNSLGARVVGAGTDVIEVYGGLDLGGTSYEIIPDRIEAGTFLVAAAITGGEVHLRHVRPDHLDAVLIKLREAGCQVEAGDASIFLRAPARPAPVDIKTRVYPGFPTDLQSQMIALLSLASGTSVVTETIFENRFKVVDELRRMGAQITTDGRVAVVRGVRRLTGAHVEAMDDLRGAAALVLGGLAAEGVTRVEGIHHLERGYEDLPGRLAAVGACLERRPVESPVL